MTGAELKIIIPAASDVLVPDVDRLATLHTNAKTDRELLKVWLKCHRHGSAHTVRVYQRVGDCFLKALHAVRSDLRRATAEDVEAALEAMCSKDDGSPVKPATVDTYVAAVKSYFGSAQRVGFTRFNAAPRIKMKKAPRQVAQRVRGELEVRMPIRAARPGRDRLMPEVAYFGGLRVNVRLQRPRAQQTCVHGVGGSPSRRSGVLALAIWSARADSATDCRSP